MFQIVIAFMTRGKKILFAVSVVSHQFELTHVFIVFVIFAFVDANLLKKSSFLMILNFGILVNLHFVEVVLRRSQFQAKLRLLKMNAFVDADLLKKSSFVMILNFVVLVKVHLLKVVLRRS